jgi:hypothetical protein
MKVNVVSLRRFVREEIQRPQPVGSLSAALDAAMESFLQVNKSLESAHALAPEGEARATIAGLHSDIFNKIAEFRGYVRRLKSLR